MKLQTITLFLVLVVLFSCNSEIDSSSNSDTVSLTPKPEIQTGKTISMDASLDNMYFIKGSQDQMVYLYVNLTGGKDTSTNERVPLNISLVIDRSGSMQDESKLKFVKDACDIIIDNLSASDNLSVVAYNSEVELIKKSGAIKNKAILKQKINALVPDKTTNLSGGMLEGYAQVKSTLKKTYVNRVLLLSDGLANVGVTSVDGLQKIVKQKYAEDGIAVSTFGVGADFNEDLMTNLAEHGRGNYYFIEKSDEIPSIFKEELSGLLSVVAQNTKVKIKFPKQYLSPENVYGFDYKIENDEIIIDYNDVFGEEEKAVLIGFKIKNQDTDVFNFDVTMSYDDVLENYTRVTESKRVSCKATNNLALHKKSYNENVIRNKVLFIANLQFDRATQEVDNGNYNIAKEIIQKNNEYMDNEFKNITPDSALIKQYEMNKSYGKEIDIIEEKTEYERKIMQKSQKNYNYKLKKKKGK